MDANEYDHHAVEAGVRSLWEEHDIYRFDREAVGPVFSVDTPPPYVSASHLHVGHAMSYSQPDFIIRYRRMKGDRIFYPMGFDDNGLPTERYVEKTYGVKAVDMPRSEFVEMCLSETRKTAARYEDVWRRLGLSVDWTLLYSTIDARCQLTAQASFIKLLDAGHICRVEDPIIWCTECRTALAQADVEDLERTGKIHNVAFTASADGRPLVIATTRPELIPACVALYFHPDDDRYQKLLGTTAKVPLFDYEVPIKTDESVEPGFGTGLMMVCTFGDGEDVLKWRRDALDLRLVVTANGRLSELAGEFKGLQLTQARSAVVTRLGEIGALHETKSLKQNVGVHERCLTPVEYQIRPQWFIKVREHQDAFLARANELSWIPTHMQRRLEDWIEGLKWDWNISRQRHYGVPFPVWFCEDCENAVTADLAALPVDPLSDAPPVGSCPQCSGRLIPDPDVMDTWMTSSLSPQINDGWASEGTDPQLAPMSLRVQAFEIIRTWLFYTIVQSQFHFDRLPWQTVLISGWGLNEQGKKIAKRDLDQSTTADGFNRYVPDHVIDRYGADALRIWATKARIGTDLRYNEKDVRTGRKFTVKMWNVARFLTMNGVDPAIAPDNTAISTEVDRWMLSHLAAAVDEVTAAMDEYDFMQGYQAASRFFWSIFCDRYIEMIKDRFLTPEDYSDTERASARAALSIGFRTALGVFAPFAPFVTEHLFQKLFRAHEDAVSVHLTAWPTAPADWRTDRSLIDNMSTILDQIRALRSNLQLGSNTRISKVALQATNDDGLRMANAIAEPLRVAARAGELVFADASHDSGVNGIQVEIFA
ncbi:MAG TPA: valine--tRNA ligase [Streptosporangiaceae bacterium]|nr:valine--tRNA ligase [Streptosporangiaceae bacterium]